MTDYFVTIYDPEGNVVQGVGLARGDTVEEAFVDALERHRPPYGSSAQLRVLGELVYDVSITHSTLERLAAGEGKRMEILDPQLLT